MADSERITSLFLFVVAAVGTALFTSGIFSPGWHILKDDNEETYEGIFFKTECDLYRGRSNCEQKTYLDEYSDNKERFSSQWGAEFEYNKRVGVQIVAVLALACCLMGTALSFFKLVLHKYTLTIGAMVSPFFIITACLIWTQIGMKSALMKEKADNLRTDRKETIDPPYSMILAAIGSFFTLSVGVVQIVFTMRGLTQIQKNRIRLTN